MLGKDLTNEEKLDAIYAMTLENHEVLKTIRRQQYFSTIMRLLYWLIILGAIGGSYYFIRPFIITLTDSTVGLEEKLNQLNQLKNQLPDTKVLDQLMQGLQKSGTSSQ
jgi:uncharacterized protein YjgD (DUF1641 family)